MPLCDPELIQHRWTKHYVQSHQRVFTTELEKQTPIQVSEKEKKKSRHQKFRIPSVITTEFSDVIFECTGKQLDNKIQVLEEILK